MTRTIVLAVVVALSFVSTTYSQSRTASAFSLRRIKTIEIPGARWTHTFDPKLARIAIVRETLRDYRTTVFSLTKAREICEFRQPAQVSAWVFGVGIQSMSFLDNENELLIVDTEGRFVFCDIERKVVDRVIRLPWFVLHHRDIAEEFEKSKLSIGVYEVVVLKGLEVRSAETLPDTKNMVVLYDDGSIVMLDIQSGHLRKTVRKGSYQSRVAKFGKDVDVQLTKTLPRLFGTRSSKSSDWVIPKRIRIGKKYKPTDTLLLGCIGGDVITSDRKGIARLNLDSGTEQWRTNSGYNHSKLTANLKLVAEIERNAIRLFRTSDGKLQHRIPIAGIGKKDELVDIKTDAKGETFLLTSQKGRLFLVSHCGLSTEIRWDASKDGTVYRTGLASDGKRIAFLTDHGAVELFEVP